MLMTLRIDWVDISDFVAQLKCVLKFIVPVNINFKCSDLKQNLNSIRTLIRALS